MAGDRPRLVVIRAYFKAGTNWTAQIAVQIAHRGLMQFEPIHEPVPWIEIPPTHRMVVPVTEDSIWQNRSARLRVSDFACDQLYGKE